MISIIWYKLWKKCSLLFGNNSWKCLCCFIWTLKKVFSIIWKWLPESAVLFDLNSYKSVYYCLVITLWKCQYYFIWPLIKVFTIICSNSLKVSLLFDMNFGKSVYYYLVVTFWKCQLAHFISAFWGKEGSYHIDILIMYLTDNIFLLRVLISRKVWQKTKYLSRWLDFFCTHMLCLAPLVILHLIFLILTEYTSFCSHSNSFIVTMYVASEDSLCLI